MIGINGTVSNCILIASITSTPILFILHILVAPLVDIGCCIVPLFAILNMMNIINMLCVISTIYEKHSQNCTDPVTVSMVGEGVVFQGMRGYTVPPHAPAVACLTMSVTQHIWLKKKYYRVPTFNPVSREATRLSGYQP